MTLEPVKLNWPALKNFECPKCGDSLRHVKKDRIVCPRQPWHFIIPSKKFSDLVMKMKEKNNQ